MKGIEAEGQEMRLYRARRKDNNEWVKGWYLRLSKKSFIAIEQCVSLWQSKKSDEIRPYLPAGSLIQVHPETVAQSTGLKDKNGDEIFEGMTVIADGWWTGIVTWQEEGSVGWCVDPLEEYKHRGMYGLNSNYVFEIISEDKP